MGWGRYPWLVGKLFALAYIFVGGGILAAVMIVVRPFLASRSDERVRASIGKVFRGYLWALQRLRMLDFDFAGMAQLKQCAGKVVVANHPCLLDVVAVMAIVPNAQCIVKHQLWNHWFLGHLMRAAGFIRNDLPPEELVDACGRALAAGFNLVVFPEGTRTTLGRAVRFHRGFANVALMTGAPIQTVVIACTPTILYKGEPWWRIPPTKPKLRVSAGICLDQDFYSRFGARGIASRKILDYLEHYYGESTAHG